MACEECEESNDASLVLLYMGSDGPLYAFSLFLPSIINEVSQIVADLMGIRLPEE